MEKKRRGTYLLKSDQTFNVSGPKTVARSALGLKG
jgi:hypothetical protein